MSLKWNIKKVSKENDFHVTSKIIWKTLAIDIGEITKKNVSEFMFRSMLHDSYFCNNKKESQLPKQQIEDHVVLKTNVTTKSRASFVSKLFKRFKEESHV